MTARPTTSKFARLLQDLSLREGEDLERALAESAAIFARLGACTAPRPRAAGPGAALSLVHAERELTRLIAREVERLCEEAAVAQDRAEPSQPTRRDLSELLLEELDCAQSMDCLPASMIEHLRDLARHLARAACEASEFREAASSIRQLCAAVDHP